MKTLILFLLVSTNLLAFNLNINANRYIIKQEPPKKYHHYQNRHWNNHSFNSRVVVVKNYQVIKPTPDPNNYKICKYGFHEVKDPSDPSKGWGLYQVVKSNNMITENFVTLYKTQEDCEKLVNP